MPRSVGLRVLIATLSAFLITAYATGASATSVLLYDDTYGTSGAWGTALTQLTLTPDVATSDGQFQTKLASQTWDLVILQLSQNVPLHNGFASSTLSAYLASGRLIFSYSVNSYDSLFQVSEKTVYDLSLIDSESRLVGLTFTPLFAAGLVFDPTSDPFTIPLACPEGGACFEPPARSFTALPGTTVAAFFQDGDPGIVVGNGNRTIINPFGAGYLGDNEVQLYKNEINYLIAVPEPATGALLGLGLVAAAALGYWRRK